MLGVAFVELGIKPFFGNSVPVLTELILLAGELTLFVGIVRRLAIGIDGVIRAFLTSWTVRAYRKYRGDLAGRQSRRLAADSAGR